MTDPDRPRFYLKEWIAHLDMTDEILSERSNVSRTHITQLKNGDKVWNERVLLKLARGLGLKEPLALFRPPTAPAIRADIWDRIPEERRTIARETADRILESFAEPESAPKVGDGKKRVRKPRN